MSNKSVTKPNPIAPTLEVPDKAPAPAFDLDNPDLNFVDLFPENFFSLEGLQVLTDELGGPLVLTVSGCTVEYVYNPENGESSGEWKPCLAFAETPTRLVLNKTRAKDVMAMAQSPLIKQWGNIGRVTIKPAIKDGHAQIVIQRAPIEDLPSLDELNEELFG